MALSISYSNALYQIIHVMGPDEYSWVRYAGLSQADAAQLYSEYQTWFLAQGSRIHEAQTEVAH